MRITVFGCGYVGLVTAACLAEAGNQVIGVDVDQDRVACLNNGLVPLYEPGLEELIRGALAAQRIFFTNDAAAAVIQADVVFIAVGTPPAADGSADLTAVCEAAATIGRNMTRPLMVVVKSTVPVGTTERVRAIVGRHLNRPLAFDVAFNPEFLKEGSAVEDFKKPDRIVIGVAGGDAEKTLRLLYAPFNRNRNKLLVMDIASAELTKYAANAMLATRISFMNEMANIAERTGADIEQVRLGIGSDPRIGYSFIYPGAGFGGSCFPKDLGALKAMAEGHGYRPLMIEAVQEINERQKQRLYEQLAAHFGCLADKTIALWGLAYKPNTTDMRQAPSRALLESLWAAGATVRAHDPKATDEAHRLYGTRSDLELCDDPYHAAQGADALVIVTEWKCYWSPDLARLRELLKHPVIFDGRNLYDPATMAAQGWEYHSIGRPSARIIHHSLDVRRFQAL